MAEKQSTNRVFLLSSVVLGVIAMMAAFVYLQNGTSEERGPKTMILVATHDMRTNTALDPEKDLAEMEIPARMVELKQRSIPVDLKASFKGQRLNRDVLAGTPVMTADLAGAGTLELKGDKRAMSVLVKTGNALGGLLIPGDWVQLLVTKQVLAPKLVRPASNPSPASDGDLPVYEVPTVTRWETNSVSPIPFRVLAVNQRLSRTRGQLTAAEQYQGAGESSQLQTITLEVTEAQAKTVLQETGGGTLPISILVCPAPTGSGSSPTTSPVTSN